MAGMALAGAWGSIPRNFGEPQSAPKVLCTVGTFMKSMTFLCSVFNGNMILLYDTSEFPIRKLAKSVIKHL